MSLRRLLFLVVPFFVVAASAASVVVVVVVVAFICFSLSVAGPLLAVCGQVNVFIIL